MTDIEALQNFLLDIECLDELAPWTSKFILFDVLKVSRKEIRHSNVLGWLLDPNENHEINDKFLLDFTKRVVENDNLNRYNILEILLMDFSTFSVYREWKNIDILLVSNDEKFVICIENKVGSHEHSNQLNRYRSILENDFPNYKKMLIYLTPDGEEPSDVDNWDVLTYTDILDILERILAKEMLSNDVRLMISNYAEVIRRDIVEDKQLVEICDKIYNKHKHALDLIYEHKTDSRNIMGKLIKDILIKRSDIRYDDNASNNSTFTFHTNAMSTYLPDLETSNSSWRTIYPYVYWIETYSDNIVGHFELGGDNISDELNQKMQHIIDLLNPNVKGREKFKYKRLYRTKKYKLPEIDNMEAMEEILNKIVEELLEMENNLLMKL